MRTRIYGTYVEQEKYNIARAVDASFVIYVKNETEQLSYGCSRNHCMAAKSHSPADMKTGNEIKASSFPILSISKPW